MALQVFLPHGTAAWSSSCVQKSSVAWQILVTPTHAHCMAIMGILEAQGVVSSTPFLFSEVKP